MHRAPASTAAALLATPALADETCQSPYLPKVTGQEDYLYVWTLGVEGLGDGSDKLVTVGANPAGPTTGDQQPPGRATRRTTPVS
jgi:selenium-binding protein 1